MRGIDRTSWPRWARIASSGWVVSPLVLVLVLVIAYEGYTFYTRHQPTTYKGGAFAGGGGTLSTTNRNAPGASGGHGRAGTAGHKAGKGSKGGRSGNPGKGDAGPANFAGSGSGSSPVTDTKTPGRPGNGDRAGQGTSGGRSPRRNGRGGAPASSAPAAPSLATPATGVYGLRVSGYEQPKFGPFSVCKNTFPSHATLDVHKASGEGTNAFDFDLRLYPGQPNKHDERHIYRYSNDSVDQVYEAETVTCSGMKQSTEVDYSPPQVRVKLPLRSGESWHNHGGGSARTESGDSKVVGASRIAVQGRSYQVYEIKTHLTMSGSETGTRDQTWWYAPSLGIPLKWTETLNGRRSGANYREQLTVTVASLPA